MITPYATIGEDVHYGEGKKDPWMIYDGPYWDYILGIDDAVLLRGTRRATVEKGAEPVLSLPLYKKGRNVTRCFAFGDSPSKRGRNVPDLGGHGYV